MHHQGLSYVPEIIRTELTTKKTWELVARKCYKDLELLPIPTHRLEGHQWRLGRDCLCLPIDQLQLGRDCLCLPIGRTRFTIRFLSSSTGWLAGMIYQGISRRDLRWKGTSYDPILANENGRLQAGADNDQCTWACGGLYRPYSPTRPTTVSPTQLSVTETEKG